jgi:DNA-binding response OmpR family regulator
MRILVVEDEKMLTENIKTGLEDENFAVDVAFNGLDAYDLAVGEDYDVIILDIMLPGMDGITLCKKLRAEKNYTPILMLTAKDAVEDKVTGLDDGADDYMVKPFSFEELLARIRSLMRRSTTKDTILKVDSLELNPSSHIVRRNGKELNLTGKEYSLLEYFMRYPNQVLTREQILSHVWDYSYGSMSNIIDVLIRRLRNKIDRDFPDEKSLFKTVRGLGYKLSS